jgi:glutamate-1-semialdehyde 2,1-aminomutase
VFSTNDREKQPSQAFRALLMQELIKRGVIGPSLIVSYAHTDDDIDQTIRAFEGSLEVYRQALSNGVERYLVGPPTQSVYRRYNDFTLDRLPMSSGEPYAAAATTVNYMSPSGNGQ